MSAYPTPAGSEEAAVMVIDGVSYVEAKAVEPARGIHGVCAQCALGSAGMLRACGKAVMGEAQKAFGGDCETRDVIYARSPDAKGRGRQPFQLIPQPVYDEHYAATQDDGSCALCDGEGSFLDTEGIRWQCPQGCASRATSPSTPGSPA